MFIRSKLRVVVFVIYTLFVSLFFYIQITFINFTLFSGFDFIIVKLRIVIYTNKILTWQLEIFHRSVSTFVIYYTASGHVIYFFLCSCVVMSVHVYSMCLNKQVGPIVK